MPPDQDPRRHELMQKAVDGWGTAAFLEVRAKKYERWLKITGFVGFILPVSIGAFVGAGALDWIHFKQAVAWVSVIGAVQTIASGFLVFAGFEKSLADTLHAAGVNKALSSSCERLAKNVFLPPDVFDKEHAKLIGECLAQERNDERFLASPKELRLAHRAGLRRFRWECAACKQIPTSNEANGSKCTNCGDF